MISSLLDVIDLSQLTDEICSVSKGAVTLFVYVCVSVCVHMNICVRMCI